ncbi:MAG: SAM-dependent methyltransferase [Turneriella sp.]|nr:SAM-dependent methyltransferase [Turneriella sp.]
MEKPASTPVHLQLSPLTDKEFAGFQKLIYEWAGIHMNESKKALVSGRLMKRLRHYNISTFSDYLRIVKGSEFPEEKQIMINLLTTNETYFFREPKHFDWLRQKIRTRNTAEKFRLWSAASSSGQEAYTIAMVIAEEMGPHGWEILGSDISERALSVAINATYPIEQAAQIPERYLKRFCLKGVRESEGKFCIRPEILQNIRFFRVNLNEALPQNFGLFDVIFLRNVMIYFDRPTRQKVAEGLMHFLKPDGNLVIGHAESLHGITERLRAIKPTIYVARTNNFT